MLIKSQQGRSQCRCTVCLWMLLNQAICSEEAYTFGVPYEQLWICMNKANSGEYAYTFGAHCLLGKYLV